jgi:L-ascorbate metabolism protein UlaG (beta-lactamase superfamily)
MSADSQPRLRDDVRLDVNYQDRDPYGTAVSGKALQRVKRDAGRLRQLWQERGIQYTVTHARALLEEVLSGDGFRDFYRGPEVLREERVYPDPRAAQPISLTIRRSGLAPAVVDLPASVGHEVARWLGAWQAGEAAPRQPGARSLWDALERLGCLAPEAAPPRLTGDATFVGHATVVIRVGSTTVVVDPFVLPRGPAYPEGYQPLAASSLRPDVVVITHSHADHFDAGTLLRFGAHVRIVVPTVARESLLAIDMAYRLRELGFTNVTALRWFDEIVVGDATIRALPFYGEQPTTESVLLPEARNFGNTYCIEGNGRRYVVLADAGRDHSGDTCTLAAGIAGRYGPVDVLFGGYRSWAIYPVQYPLTSVPFHLLFVPRAQWTVRQEIMNNAHALLDAAERMQARFVVPYADGGAPWYWERGLGPRLDVREPDNVHFEPRPDQVVEAARSRSAFGALALASPVRALLMRPGDSLQLGADGDARVVANDGHRWPYGEADAGGLTGTDGEPQGLTRKRVLLRLLSWAELARRGEQVDEAEVQLVSDQLRRIHGLHQAGSMRAWLADAGLSSAEYTDIVRDWCAVVKVETAFQQEIQALIGGQNAFASMRLFAGSHSP